MAPVPLVTPDHSIVVCPEPLTPAAFAAFGTVISSPIASSLRTVPSSHLSAAKHPAYQPPPQLANQQTALKTSPISPLTNNYPQPDSSLRKNNEARGLMSIFSCFPRENTYIDSGDRYGNDGKHKLRVEILERHPYTSQTFCPFNFSRSSNRGSSDRRSSYFLVIVAPTVEDADATPSNPPDLSKIRAFVAPTTVDDSSQGMAVTYAPGTWHAPMVVLGDRRVDFLVTQFANGRDDDDCQETLVGTTASTMPSSASASSIEKQRIVEVDLDSLNIHVPREGQMSKARL